MMVECPICFLMFIGPFCFLVLGLMLLFLIADIDEWAQNQFKNKSAQKGTDKE